MIEKKSIKKALLIASCLTSALIMSPKNSLAIDTTIQATINFRASITTSVGNDMNFGDVTYDASHNGQIELATDGTVQIAGGSNGLSLSGGSSTAGDISISGDNQSMIDISCESGGTLAAPSGDLLPLQNVELSVGGGTSYGNGTACAGLSTPVTNIDLGLTPTPQIFFGGMIDVMSNSITQNDRYDTLNAGGDPVRVRVVYQ